MPNPTGFTSFLIALCHHRELLDQFLENPEESFSGWNLTAEQQEILKRRNLDEIQAEVRHENPDSAVAPWVMAETWVMGPDWVMTPEDEDADEDEGYSTT